MSTLLIVLGYIAGYLAVGVGWARTQAVRLQRRINEAEGHTCWAGCHEGHPCPAPWYGDDLAGGLLPHVLLWPISVVARTLVTLYRGGSTLVVAPVSKRRTRAAELREQAKGYDDMLRDTEIPDGERKLIRELQDSLRAQAKTIDL